MSTAWREAAFLPALAIYRLSNRRVLRAPELYRAGIVWQQFTLGRVPGMTTLTERAYFNWHAQEVFTGAGEIVDLGSWFGSTATALARGLAKNRHPTARGRVVHAYERFAWEPWMDAYAHLARRGPYREGDSFRPEFDLVTKRWRDRIEVHAGDLFSQRWDERPIEVLLVDAMKTWELARHIVTEFYPTLLEDRGHIIHQDFSHCYTPWIHLISYHLRESFAPVHDVSDSETFVLRRMGELPTSGEMSLSRDDYDEDEVQRAFAYSLSITPPEKHSGILAARVMLAVYDGDLEAASSHLRSFEGRQELSPMHAQALATAITAASGAPGKHAA